MGNYPSMGTGGGEIIGALEFNMCKNSCCFCCDAWYGCANPCCKGLATPSGPEWEAAKPGFKVLLDEAYHIADKDVAKCCACCNDVFAMKSALDEKWTGRANEFLAQHKLKVEVHAFYTSDGKNTTPVQAAASCPRPRPAMLPSLTLHAALAFRSTWSSNSARSRLSDCRTPSARPFDRRRALLASFMQRPVAPCTAGPLIRRARPVVWHCACE